MNIRRVGLLNVVTFSLLIALIAGGLSTTSRVVAAADEAATEDVIYMVDGRELRGKILEESRGQIIFEYRDPNINITTKITLQASQIAHIDRNVPIEGMGDEAFDDFPDETGMSSEPVVPASALQKRGRMQTDATNVPSFYIVPMKGQMGTDIRSSVYTKVIEDIRANKPDLVIIEMECSDTSELMHPGGYDMQENPLREWGMLDFEDYRELVSLFRDRLRDIPQVVWIHDSDGISAVVAMAWDQIYMAPGARLGAKISVLDRSGAKRWSDADVRAKMVAAWLGIAQGFLERGGFSPVLARAMLDSEPKLSGTWRGREVIWSLDERGEYLVDGSDKRAAYFTARSAEDFCISQGTAADLDDLALLLGHREYRLVGERQHALTTGYVHDWRRLYENVRTWMIDYQQHRGWATGNETLRWLGRAKQDLEKVFRAMDRYKAIELRLESDYGLTRHDLTVEIELLNEQIRSLRNRGRGVGAGGGAGGSGASGRGGRSPGGR